MEKITITPGRLAGTLNAPPSKSSAHRLLICAALADGDSVVHNAGQSQDIEVTLSAMRALGCKLQRRGTDIVCGAQDTPVEAGRDITIDCGESGSTLRFLIPIALAKGGAYRFTGRGRLLLRPLEPYYDMFRERGIVCEPGESSILFRGRLTGGIYSLPGNVSSQFITGLLFALPLLKEDSVIRVTTPLESAGYVEMTLGALRTFGISVSTDGYREFHIPGNQRYLPRDCTVEGDYSHAAFYLVANALGSDVRLSGLDPDSTQGDKAIIEIIKKMGSPLSAMPIDVSQIPDLLPVLAVLATQAEGETRLFGAGRLRIKESDRLQTITQELKRLGADITELPDELIIRGRTPLSGGVCDAHNDHRIAMALAIAATVANGEVTVCDAECVKKSYPEFWQDYRALGGKLHG